MMSAIFDLIFVDDERKASALFQRFCEGLPYRPHVFEHAADALKYFRTEGADLLITDLRMPQMDGIELLRNIREIDHEIPVIIMTAHSTVNAAIEALRLGAIDFLPKPFEMQDLLALIDRTLSSARLKREVQRLRVRLRESHEDRGIIGTSSAMDQIHQIVNKIADVRCNVIIEGETGTGKELVARAIHESCSAADEPFVVVDCGALNDTLLESELFGHRKGAFTGANEHKRGLVEMASGGTIFLDEIGNISDALQIKLLRVIQEQQVLPVGGVTPTDIDVRWLVATNENLKALTAEGRFRLDLFHRLNVVKITTPSLRERRRDIPLLVQHFVREFDEKYQRGVTGFDRESMQRLERHDWPGNVRELKNLVERHVVLADTPLMQVEELEGQAPGDDSLDHDWPTLNELERRYLLKALERFGGNQTRAAEALGIDKSTLWRKLQQYKRAEVSVASSDA